MIFEIIIDGSIKDTIPTFSMQPINNKALLSIINDFENGSWRYNIFQNYVWDNIAETCLNFQERDSLVNHSLLSAAAKKLRLTDSADAPGEGSELAEILLYALMKDHYHALPVVPKIFYKQNSQDYAKGSDSVHIVLEGGDKFSLWFGEAKFYNSIDNTRLGIIVDSVYNSLRTDKLKKELSIISGVSDLSLLITDVQLLKSIRNSLSYTNSIDNIKKLIHVPILLLYECEITAKETEMSEKYKNKLREYHIDRAKAYFEKQIEKLSSIHKYSEINFHFILFPVPEKKKIVDRFIDLVGIYRGE